MKAIQCLTHSEPILGYLNKGLGVRAVSRVTITCASAQHLPLDFEKRNIKWIQITSKVIAYVRYSTVLV